MLPDGCKFPFSSDCIFCTQGANVTINIVKSSYKDKLLKYWHKQAQTIALSARSKDSYLRVLSVSQMFNPTTRTPFLEITTPSMNEHTFPRCPWNDFWFQPRALCPMLCSAMCFPAWCTPPGRPPVPVDLHPAQGTLTSFSSRTAARTLQHTLPTRIVNNKYLSANLNFGLCASDTYKGYQQVYKMFSRKKEFQGISD